MCTLYLLLTACPNKIQTITNIWILSIKSFRTSLGFLNKHQWHSEKSVLFERMIDCFFTVDLCHVF